jgi:uncharacterized membrane protein
MAAIDRSISDVLHDIVGNVQEIVRSEVRLAKTEMSDKAASAKPATVWLGVGAITALFAVFFFLLAIFHALTMVMPNWVAALTVAVPLAAIAAGALNGGVKRFKSLNPSPDRTIAEVKKEVQWVKQQIK